MDSEDAVRELIRAGAGISLLREDDADGMQARGEAVCWSGPTPSVRLGFAVQRQRAGEPLVSALQSVIADMWLEHAATAGSAEA